VKSLKEMPITNYLFTPSDVRDAFHYLVTHITRRDATRILIVIVACAAMQFLGHSDPESIIFALILLSTYLWRWDARLPLGAGIACLIGIFFLQLGYQTLIVPQGNDWSERVAVWAFYFLAIGVLKQTVDLIIESHRQPKGLANSSETN
jgi:hypothetical protein